MSNFWRFSSRNHGVPRDFFDGGSATQPQTQWKMRRDTDAKRATCLLADGEPFWTTDNDELWIGDGSTMGGILVTDTSTGRYQVKITSADTTGSYLQAALVAGTGITLTKNNAGANETLTIAAATAAGVVFGPEPSTDLALARWDGVTGELLQDGQILQSDIGGLSKVASITGSADGGSYSDWADATVYTVGDKAVSTNAEGGDTSYVCILNHTSDFDNDRPGTGANWELYWESLDEILDILGPVRAQDGMNFNRQQIRAVSGIRFTWTSGNEYAFWGVSELSSNSVNYLPVEPGFERGCLMVASMDGNVAQLEWSQPALDEVVGSFGADGQYLVTNGSDTIEWRDRPITLRGFFGGQPTDVQLVDSFIADRALTWPANFAGGYAKAKTASTGTMVFTVKKNGSTVGTITFTSSATGTLATSGAAAITVAAGDVLDFYAPTMGSDALADISWSLPAKILF